RTLRRCFLPFAIYPALGEDWRFHRPVPHDLDIETRGGRAHLQMDGRARQVGIGVGVAPDFTARTVHAGIFVIMAEDSLAPLRRGQPEIGKIASGSLVHCGTSRSQIFLEEGTGALLYRI